jgi:hypothetical protein
MQTLVIEYFKPTPEKVELSIIGAVGMRCGTLSICVWGEGKGEQARLAVQPSTSHTHTHTHNKLAGGVFFLSCARGSKHAESSLARQSRGHPALWSA